MRVDRRRVALSAVVALAIALAVATLPALSPATASAPDYTIAVMPDVQIYSREPSLRYIHTAMTDWIASEAVTRNIRAVMYPGDLVEYGMTHGADSALEWDAVEAGIDVLDAAGLPYTLAIGNHDYDSDWAWREVNPIARSADDLTFNARFGPARHASHAWWIGGEFEPGKADNAYTLQNIGGRRVLFMALEFGPRQAVVDWANRVLAYHAEKPAYIVTHSAVYFDDGWLAAPDLYGPHEYQGHPDTHDGSELWDALFRRHGNVVAVFSGHQIQGEPYSIGRVTGTADRGNPVHGMLFNLQDRLDGGSGYIRLVTVSEAAGSIDVETYSPVLDAYLTGDRHAFTLAYAPILSPATSTATVALPPATSTTTIEPSTATPTNTATSTTAPTNTQAPTSTPAPTATPADVSPRDALATVAVYIADYLTRVPAATETPSPTDTPAPTATRTPTQEPTMALTDSLAAYYKLDESSGNAIDALGVSDLTASGSPPTATTGKVGGCRVFVAASSQMFSRADNAALSTGDIDYTLAMWVYLTSKPAATMDMLSRYDVGNVALREYLFVWNATNDRFEFYITNTAGGNNVVTANNFGAPSTGTWYYVVAWHDAAGNTINISVNNGTANSAATSVSPSDTAVVTTLGGRTGIATRYWDGRLDEVGYWKRVLTVDERTSLYNGGAGLAYPFTTGAGAALASNVFESPIFGGLAVR